MARVGGPCGLSAAGNRLTLLSSGFDLRLAAQIQNPHDLAVFVFDLDFVGIDEPNGSHTVEAELMANDIAIAAQDRLAAVRGLPDSKLGNGFQD
jgi:hypothetical protein